jgi:hypothetical protein
MNKRSFRQLSGARSLLSNQAPAASCPRPAEAKIKMAPKFVLKVIPGAEID